MKTALEGGKNKQHQTQTKTLETKTIRIKSWRNSLRFLTSTPAYLFYAAGFFMLLSLPVLANDQGSEQNAKDDSSNAEVQGGTSLSVKTTTPDDAESGDTSNPDTDKDPTHPDYSAGSSTSVSINMSVSSSSNGEETNPEPTVSINGHTVELPSNGRFNEKFEDEHSDTRLRGRIDAESGASIRISTDSKMKTEGD